MEEIDADTAVARLDRKIISLQCLETRVKGAVLVVVEGGARGVCASVQAIRVAVMMLSTMRNMCYATFEVSLAVLGYHAIGTSMLWSAW